MLKFLIGLATGVLLTALMVLIVVFAIARFRSKPPEIAANSVLMLRLDGEIPERPPVEFPFFVPFGNTHYTPTVQSLWATLRKAANDSRIRAVLFEPRGMHVGWGKLQELRADLENFKRSGKPLVASLRTAGTGEYYLASAADKIYITPEDALMLKGLHAEMMYFKRTLDKVGVNVEVQHAGKYKDFGDMFVRTGLSPETRQVYDSILDELYGNLCQTIGSARKMSADQVKRLIDKAPFLSTEAKTAGLVDDVLYEDQIMGAIRQRLHSSDLHRASLAQYAGTPDSTAGLDGKDKIAFLVGEGSILGGGESGDSGDLHSGSFNKLLRQVRSDSSIKGVIVRIDSPGGEVTASAEIWREMNLLRERKPVIISMSDVAASGGYYMASTGDTILAYPGTFTGSIGVVYGKPNLHGLYDKLGIDKDGLKRGEHADIDTDYRAMSPSERAKLAAGIDATYRDFVSKVAQARKRRFDEVEPLAQGRVWLGSQARQKGLVDELGGIDRAIELIKQKAQIPASERVSLVVYPPRRSFFEVFLRRSGENEVEGRVRRILRASNVSAWLRGGMLSLMPFTFEVN